MQPSLVRIIPLSKPKAQQWWKNPFKKGNENIKLFILKRFVETESLDTKFSILLTIITQLKQCCWGVITFVDSESLRLIFYFPQRFQDFTVPKILDQDKDSETVIPWNMIYLFEFYKISIDQDTYHYKSHGGLSFHRPYDYKQNYINPYKYSLGKLCLVTISQFLTETCRIFISATKSTLMWLTAKEFKIVASFPFYLHNLS